MPRSLRHYINLTNGLEALPAVAAHRVPWAFMRMRSTTIEHADWPRLMGEVPDDLLMHLALGHRCIIHDRGTRRALSKTIYFGVPLVHYLLARRWYGEACDDVRLVGGRGGEGPDVTGTFERIYADLFERAAADRGQTKQRVDYYRRYLCGEGVQLEGASESTEHDGDVEFYAMLASLHGRAP